jgi:hypothetical protein
VQLSQAGYSDAAAFNRWIRVTFAGVGNARANRIHRLVLRYYRKYCRYSVLYPMNQQVSEGLNSRRSELAAQLVARLFVRHPEL